MALKNKPSTSETDNSKVTFRSFSRGFVFWSVASFFVYEYNIGGYKDYLSEEVGKALFESNKDLNHAVSVFCAPGTQLTTPYNEEFLQKLEMNRKIVGRRLADLGLEHNIPQVTSGNSTICKRDPAVFHNIRTPAVVAGGKNIIFFTGSPSNDTIRHEMGHIFQDYIFPLWLQEYHADVVALISKRGGVYDINHIWGNILNLSEQDILILTYSEQDSLRELKVLLLSRLNNIVGLEESKKEELLSVLLNSDSRKLISYTGELIKNGGIWEDVFEGKLDQIRSLDDKYKSIEEPELNIFWRFNEYMTIVSIYIKSFF